MALEGRMRTTSGPSTYLPLVLLKEVLDLAGSRDERHRPFSLVVEATLSYFLPSYATVHGMLLSRKPHLAEGNGK